MRITLEKGENLEVLIVENDKVVGRLSLQLTAIAGISKEKATLAGETTEPTPAGRTRARRTLSPEARAKLAQAQRERWARVRAQLQKQQGAGENQGSAQ